MLLGYVYGVDLKAEEQKNVGYIIYLRNMSGIWQRHLEGKSVD